jgi:hypothetical protein
VFKNKKDLDASVERLFFPSLFKQQSSKRTREDMREGQEEFSVCLKHNSFSANEIFSNAKGFSSMVPGWLENS